MSLEDFRDADASALHIGKLTAMISRSQTIYLNHHLEDYSINATQLHLLHEISCQTDINQERIASRCNINKGSVARSIRKLEENGLVKRQIDDTDRRQNKVSLTKKGENVLNESITILDAWEDEVLKDMKIIEKEKLQEALKEIAIRSIELNLGEKDEQK